MYAPKLKLLYCIHDFHWIKISPSPATFVLQKKLVENFSPMRSRSCNLKHRIKAFLLVKISTYMVHVHQRRYEIINIPYELCTYQSTSSWVCPPNPNPIPNWPNHQTKNSPKFSPTCIWHTQRKR